MRTVTDEEMAAAWADERRAKQEHNRRRDAVEQAEKDQAGAWDAYVMAVRVRCALMTLQEVTKKP